MSSDGGLISPQAAARTAEAVREVERMRGNANRLPPGGFNRGMSNLPPGGVFRMVVTSEIIQPNAFGNFRFARGSKGSETAIEDDPEFKGFWRPPQETGALPIPADTLCYAIWIDSIDLEEDETGWELTPVYCLVPEEEEEEEEE